MRKWLVVLVLYLLLGSESAAVHRQFPLSPHPVRGHLGSGRIYPGAQSYDPFYSISAQYIVYRSYYTPYRYAGNSYLPEQSSSLPLGWNRYYLASRLQVPYSLIIRNAPVYSGYREDAEARQSRAPSRPSTPPVSVHTIPPRTTTRPSLPPAASPGMEISRGMTEEQVRSQLGFPMIQVVLGDVRSFVYDRFVVEFEKGRVRNVLFR